VDWTTLYPGLVSLVSSLASEDIAYPLPDGVVTWFNRDTPFICPQTQAGIYLRILSQTPRGRPGTVYNEVTIGGVRKLQATRTKQEKLTLQIQAKSLDATDETESLVWVSRVRDRIWDCSVGSYLRRLGLAVIELRPTIEVRENTDNRDVSIVSLDLVFQVVNIVQGIPVHFIEHIGISGTITGSTQDPIVVPEFTV
jgi:hypothetical protein